MNPTKIPWCTHTVNPFRATYNGKRGWACVKKTSGCANCYAETLNARFGTGLPFTAESMAKVEWELDEKALLSPLKRRKPAVLFWEDMGDLFGDWRPFEQIDRCAAVVAMTPHITHIWLTKRPDRMREYWMSRSKSMEYFEAAARSFGRTLRWELPTGQVVGLASFPLPNLILGASVSNQSDADALLPHLLRCPAAKRIVSYEPAVGPVDFMCVGPERWDVLHGWKPDAGEEGRNTSRIDGIVCGCESGTNRRPMEIEWALATARQCKRAGVCFYGKQFPINGRVSTMPCEWPIELTQELPWAMAKEGANQ